MRTLQVIAVDVCIGEGTVESPNQLITEFWSMDGEKLAQGCVQEPSDLILNYVGNSFSD